MDLLSDMLASNGSLMVSKLKVKSAKHQINVPKKNLDATKERAIGVMSSSKRILYNALGRITILTNVF